MNEFRSVVVKELRGNLLWGVLGLLGVSATLVILFQGSNPIAVAEWFYSTLLISKLFTATALSCAAVGLLLGLAQTLPENRGDKWSFLAHRPMSRTSLFWAKTLAGLILYAAATVLPIGIALLWMSRPGHLPYPFDWLMGLPPLADFLCGIAFYFAGVFTAMREARWYLTRTFGVIVAALCLVAVTRASEFSGALLWLAPGVLVLAAAAWGTFISGGKYSTQPRFQRAATGIVITAALAGLGAVSAGFLLTLSLDEYVAADSWQYVLTSDGTFVKAAFDDHYKIAAITDLQDQPMEKYRGREGQGRDTLSHGVYTTHLSPRSTGLSSNPTWGQPGYRQPRHFGERLDSGDPERRRDWYYSRRLGLIATMDRKTHRILGWLGPEGFSPGKNPAVRGFDRDLLSADGSHVAADATAFLTFSAGIYRAVLDENRSEKMFTAASGESVWAASGVPPTRAIVTSKRILLTEPNGTVLDLPHDLKPDGYGEIQVARVSFAVGTPIFVTYRPASFERPLQITQWDPRGTMLKRFTLPSLYQAAPTHWSEVAAQTLWGYIAANGIGGILWFEVFPRLDSTSWIVCASLSIFSGLAAFFRGRAFAFTTSRLLLWTSLAVLLGPVGFVLMLALLDWPARERCARCQRLRVVTREHCEHCSAPVAAPQLDGTEIFEVP
jgi:hypothetical protein